MAIARWIARRAGLSALTLIAVSILIFAATQVLPGDPAIQVLGHSALPSQLAAFRVEHGLNDPVTAQYWHWARGFLQGSLGSSMASGQPVGETLRQSGEASLALVLYSAIIAIPLGILLGSWAAVRRDRPLDHGIQVVMLVLTALPEYVLGLLLAMLLATTVFTVLPAVALIPIGGSAFTSPKALALPVFTLVLSVVPYLARLQRATMIDVLESEYVQMARLKGLSDRVIVRRHALPNSLVPVVQGSALTLIWLSGSIVTIEYLFAFPGLGSALQAAVNDRDIPVIQAIVLILAAVYVVVNLIADCITILLSPKLRTKLR